MIDRQSEAPVDVHRLRRLAGAVLDDLGVPPALAVDVTCVDSEEMTALHVEHMGEQGPTDVLAFPIDAPEDSTDEVPGILGDVVLCPGVAARQASEAGKPGAEEVEMLLVHGLLHLLGYDHEESAEREVMFGLTARLLAAHGERGS